MLHPCAMKRSIMLLTAIKSSHIFEGTIHKVRQHFLGGEGLPYADV